MAENRGFGKDIRNAGNKPAAKGGKATGAFSIYHKAAARGADFGAVRSGKSDSTPNFRGTKPRDAGSDRGSSDFRGTKPRDAGSDRGSSDFRGIKPRDAQSDRGPASLRGGRPKDAQGDSRPAEARGGRPKYAQNNSRPADARSTGSRPQDAGGFKGGPGTDRAYGQKDTYSKRDDMQDNRNFAEEDNTLGFQEDIDMLEGRNSVLEALKSGRSINRIYVAKGDREGSVNQIIAMARQSHLLIQEVDRVKLDAMSQTHAHQGVIALAAAKDYVEVDDILASAAASGKPPFIIILDEITDSYNLGSILRTANAAGAHGVIIPKRRAVGLTSAVSKASAGAIEYVPVARVTNIVQTIENLKKQNIWVVGTDSSGDKSYFERDLTGSIALVIGSEGEGMGKLVRESCDFIVNIPMLGQISSLNAAVAGAIVTYEILRQRSKK